MTINELRMLQALPLEIKIEKTKLRIQEWVEHFGLEHVYVSYSGGKDSEVLANIANELYPGILMIFANTGMELPGTIKQVLKRKKQGWNIKIITPRKNFKQVITEYGYPVVSKEQSGYIDEFRNTKSKKLKKIRWFGSHNGRFKISEKWKYLIDADFKISNKCCYWLKKEPIKRVEKELKIRPMVAVMAEESHMRENQYLKTGCNSFDCKRGMSKPMGFWREEDVWKYISKNKIDINEEYTVNGCKRTGCYGCLYGCHIEERNTGTNRILELKRIYPKLYEHLMQNLNYKHVMQVLGLKTFDIQQLEMF